MTSPAGHRGSNAGPGILEETGNLSPRNTFIVNRPTSFARRPTMTLGEKSPSSRFADMLTKGMMILAALAAYTFGGLLVNWSVTVAEPPEAQVIKVNLPPLDDTCKTWLGVQLEHQGKILKVTSVSPGGLARGAKVLVWDEVAYLKQEGKTIFSKGKTAIDDIEILQAYFKSCDSANWNGKDVKKLIDASKGTTVIFDMKGVVVKRGSPYLEIGIILAKGVVGVPLLLCCLFFIDAGQVKAVFSFRILRLLFIPALGWALGDVCEILANGKINAAMYSVLSQARLVGTAACMFLVLGQRQTSLQLMTLVALSILIFCYLQVPDMVPEGKYWNGFGKPKSNEDKEEADDALGFAFAFAKIFISIVTGVVGQKALQDSSIQDLPFVALQAAIFVDLTIAMIPCTALYWYAVGWEHSFFGGDDVRYWHCGLQADEKECIKGDPLLTQPQGWDYRTVLVCLFYIYRDCANNSVLRVFDAMIKNLVNAGATGATYALSLLLPPRKIFNVTKCGLVCTVVILIQMYASLPKPSSPTLNLPKPSPVEPLVSSQRQTSAQRQTSEDTLPSSSQINIGLSTISSSEKKAEPARY